jgi:hypothetical protein
LARAKSAADIVDYALTEAGEVTNGNSPYEAQVLNYLTRVHSAIVAGGTIPLLKDQTVTVDETWSWARSKTPLVLELQPAYTTGSVTISRGNESGTFFPAPAISLLGYHFRISGREEVFRIVKHVANETTFELDSAYPDASVTGVTFSAFKIDYTLIPSFIVVSDKNNKIQFQKTAGTTLTGTLTNGVYTPAQLATHVASVMTTAASGPTITGSFSSVSGHFTLTSNGAGSTTLIIIGSGSQSKFSIHKTLGFDDETSVASLTQESNYVFGGIARLIEPFRIYKGFNTQITGEDPESFHRNYGVNRIQEGNPDRFAIIEESSDGLLKVRFNKYPTMRTRIEIDHVEVPRDLKDNAASIPLIPGKHIDILEDAATFRVMLNKSDDRAQIYANMVSGKISAMVNQHRGGQQRTGKFFGQIVPRKEMLERYDRRFVATPYSEPVAESGTVQTLIQETIGYSSFFTAALTRTITAHTLAANRTMFSIIIKHTQAFVGAGISALTLDVGILSDTDKFITSFDVLQAVSDGAQDSVLTVYYPGTLTAITVTATAVGANLDQLTAGSVDLFFLESINA